MTPSVVETRKVGMHEAASFLGVTPRMLQLYAQRGQVPAAKVGKHWRFDLRLLEEWYTRKAKANVA